MKLPRTVRLDTSDTKVFEQAAEAGEWAIPGSFEFLEADPAALAPKARQAFANGWLGLGSFGRATLVEVAELDDAGLEDLAHHLAEHFVRRYGAPDVAAALPVAREELAYAASLCDHKLHTLLALQREPGPDGLVERVRIVTPARPDQHAKIWEIFPEE